MPHLKTQCPQCQKNLKLATEPREGKRVGCPRCGHRFVPVLTNGEAEPSLLFEVVDEPAPAPEPTPASAPTNSPIVGGRANLRKPVMIAAAGALLFVGICIASAVVYTQGNPGQATVAQTTKPEPPAPPTQDDAKEKARREEEKRRADFDKLMADGNLALADQQYDAAAKAYSEALRLFPQNVDAAKGASEAKSRLGTLTKEKEEADRKAADFARLMDAGKEAMTGKQYALAVRSFDNALLVMPGQPDAIKASGEAKEKLATDTDEKKKLADYEKYLAAGRAALTGARYPDAIRDFTAALVLLPNDPTAMEGKRAAEKRITDEQNDEKRRDNYHEAMKIGDASMKAKKYQDAVTSYQLALKLYPDEKDAQQALKQAKDAMNSAVTTFNNLMAQGQTAGQLGRWADAAASYSQASQLFPDNNLALRALQNAQLMMQSGNTGQAAYLQYMTAAATAMQLRRWADATAAYSAALRLVPNSVDATIGLAQAETNLAREVKNRTALVQLLETGANAYQQGRYGEAVRAYKDALLIDPNNLAAQAGLRQARYSEHMAAGNNNMRAKKYTDAQRDFEAALREAPGDPAATQAWQQARSLSMKK